MVYLKPPTVITGFVWDAWVAVIEERSDVVSSAICTSWVLLEIALSVEEVLEPRLESAEDTIGRMIEISTTVFKAAAGWPVLSTLDILCPDRN